MLKLANRVFESARLNGRWCSLGLLAALVITAGWSPSGQAQAPGQNFGPGLGNRPQKSLRLPFSDEGTFVRHTTTEVYQELGEIEDRLYNRLYTTETLKDRIKRIEKTLFGGNMRGDLEARFIEIKQKLKIANVADPQTDRHEPMIEYLERKLFQRTFEDISFENRVSQLESHVFGRTFPDYPLDVRIKKLTYTIPIMAKEIRVVSEGTVVATTRKQPGTTPVTPTPKPVILTPEGETVLTGNYLENTHRQSNGKFLRWMTLPVKIHVQNASTTEEGIVEEAIALWRTHFPVQLVENPYQADILVDWKKRPAGPGPITRPILHIDAEKTIRTAILIDMTPYKTLTPQISKQDPIERKRCLRGLLHQLGHAAGLWGHSSNPSDIMFPLHHFELTDIPDRWNRRSPRRSDLAPSPAYPEELRPSQRDINTLTKIYSREGQDLRTYSPYN
jgi:predicted Zn-dependent protease